MNLHPNFSPLTAKHFLILGWPKMEENTEIASTMPAPNATIIKLQIPPAIKMSYETQYAIASEAYGRTKFSDKFPVINVTAESQ